VIVNQDQDIAWGKTDQAHLETLDFNGMVGMLQRNVKKSISFN
jgi:hypothetical protein